MSRRNKKQEQFVENMANPDIKSQTEAYMKAYGCDEETARVNASRLLTNANILASIENRKKAAAQYANVTPEMVLGATALRAFATSDDAFDEEGNFDIRKARRTGAIHLVKKLSRRPTKFGMQVSVEFYSNETAQDKLGNYLGMDKAPTEEKDARLEQIKRAVQARAEEKGISYEEELKNYLNRFALPDIKEKLASELEN